MFNIAGNAGKCGYQPFQSNFLSLSEFFCWYRLNVTREPHSIKLFSASTNSLCFRCKVPAEISRFLLPISDVACLCRAPAPSADRKHRWKEKGSRARHEHMTSVKN
eukprot:4159027-Pyramimonas_sp.AAC.2